MKSLSRELSEPSSLIGRRPNTRHRADRAGTSLDEFLEQKWCSAFALTGFGEVGPPPQVATHVALGEVYMASRLGFLWQETPTLGYLGESTRLHLVIDADLYWLPAHGEDLYEMTNFLNAAPGIELTLITREPAWDTCLCLTQRPWVLPHHLIAEHGEEILHLTDGGEWSPDLEFEDWKRLLGNPLDYSEPRHLSLPVVALEYLECNCNSPRPLLVCLGSPELKPIAGLADRACLPASWAHAGNHPADTSFMARPSLKGLLRVLKPIKHHALQTARTNQPVLNH